MPRRKSRDSGFSEGRLSLLDSTFDPTFEAIEEMAGEEAAAAAAGQPHQVHVTNTQVIQASSKIHPYSGRDVGTRFAGPAGPIVEVMTASVWLSQVERVAAAAAWEEDVKLAQAMLALAPLQPAATWLQLQEQLGTAPTTWDDFKRRLKAEFTCSVDTAQRAEILKSFTQGKEEKVNEFFNRLSLGMEQLVSGLVLTPLTAGQAPAQPLVNKAVKEFKEYFLATFFLMGLREPMLTDVTKSGKSSLADMLAVAKRCENALIQQRHNQRAVSAVEPAGAAGGQAQSAQSLQAMIEQTVKKVMGMSKPGDVAAASATSTKNKNRPLEEVTCFYCLKKGHYATNCEDRKKDRDAGRWRPTIRDAPMSKEEWNALPTSEKNKGRNAGKASGAAPAAPTSAVTPGRSFSQAANGISVTDEAAWADYYAQRAQYPN